MKVLKLLERVDGKVTRHTGRYLVYYNSDLHERETLITCEHPQHAQVFPDAGAALEYWRTPVTCNCHATRPDGKPNRPLTAYNVVIEDAPPDPLLRDALP